jgi:cell division protein FtsN
VVGPVRHRSRSGLALLCVALLLSGLLALLLLNISIGKGAYELTALEAQQRQLAVEQQSLVEQVEAAGAPQALARNARRLSMVPAPNTVFVKLPDGRLEGTPATAEAAPKPVPKPAGKAAAKAPRRQQTTAKPPTPKRTAAAPGR